MTPPLDRITDLAGPVSRETVDALVAFEALFRKWSAQINLASRNALHDLWERHILDSLQICPAIPRGAHIVDMGSGGGFPGAILAIVGVERAQRVSLIESNAKKCAFLQLATASTGARVHNLRLERGFMATGPAHVVTARALTALPELLEFSLPWVEAGAFCLFHKGRDYQREVEASLVLWSYDLEVRPSRTEAGSVILEIRNLRRKGAAR